MASNIKQKEKLNRSLPLAMWLNELWARKKDREQALRESGCDEFSSIWLPDTPKHKRLYNQLVQTEQEIHAILLHDMVLVMIVFHKHDGPSVCELVGHWKQKCLPSGLVPILESRVAWCRHRDGSQGIIVRLNDLSDDGDSAQDGADPVDERAFRSVWQNGKRICSTFRVAACDSDEVCLWSTDGSLIGGWFVFDANNPEGESDDWRYAEDESTRADFRYS
jgi:hypothetical protein